MASDPNTSTNQTPPLTGSRRTVHLVAVGVVILFAVALFLYLGGWFIPHKLTPPRFVDGFQKVNGIYSGFRRNHAKGVCVTGSFASNGQGTRLSKAIVFRTGRLPVIGRFSFGGGNPYVADNPNLVRGMGLLFWSPNGEEWRMAMINFPVFPVKTPQDFYDNLIASQPDPNTHKPDPEKIAAFLAKHPETVQAMKIIKSHEVSSGFDNSVFNSLNAFRFVDSEGRSVFVRWSMVPLQPFAPANASESAGSDKNSLFDALIAAIHQQPLQWHLVITIGQPGDPTNDASIPWPDAREHVGVGTLTLDHIESEETGACRVVNFDPLVLPEGIAPSDDPLLSARSAVYSQSFTRRAGEKELPSAITPSEVQK